MLCGPAHAAARAIARGAAGAAGLGGESAPAKRLVLAFLLSEQSLAVGMGHMEGRRENHAA